MRSATKQLKKWKADCTDGIFYDNLINVTEMLFSYISMLFSMMLTRGVAPQGLLLSTLGLIPKNTRDNKWDSNNYRQIAISSLHGKIFDTIILDKQKMMLETDVLQFSVKKNSSNVISTFMLIYKKPLIIIMKIKLIAIYYCWMPRSHLTELDITNYLIGCVS